MAEKYVVSPDGNFGTIDDSEWTEAEKNGWIAASPEAIAKSKEKDEYTGVVGTIAAPIVGAIKGTGLLLPLEKMEPMPRPAPDMPQGLEPQWLRDFQDTAGKQVEEHIKKPIRDVINKLEEYNPVKTAAGEIAGMVAPALFSGGASIFAKGLTLTPAGRINALGRAVAKGSEQDVAKIIEKYITKEAPLLAWKGTRAASKITGSTAQGIVEGALYSAQQTATNNALGKYEGDKDKFTTALITNTTFGALLGGGAGGILGAAEVALPSVANWTAEQKILENTGKHISGWIDIIQDHIQKSGQTGLVNKIQSLRTSTESGVNGPVAKIWQTFNDLSDINKDDVASMLSSKEKIISTKELDKVMNNGASIISSEMRTNLINNGKQTLQDTWDISYSQYRKFSDFVKNEMEKQGLSKVNPITGKKEFNDMLGFIKDNEGTTLPKELGLTDNYRSYSGDIWKPIEEGTLSTNIQQKIMDEGSTKHITNTAKGRIKQTGEVFTPSELVNEMLNQLPEETWQQGKTFLDPACGNGQFLAAVTIAKKELGDTNPLKSIYGVDLMKDNVIKTRQRLLDIVGDTTENRKIVEKNIVNADSLKYDFSFGEPITKTETQVAQKQAKNIIKERKTFIENKINEKEIIEKEKLIKSKPYIFATGTAEQFSKYTIAQRNLGDNLGKGVTKRLQIDTDKWNKAARWSPESKETSSYNAIANFAQATSNMERVMTANATVMKNYKTGEIPWDTTIGKLNNYWKLLDRSNIITNSKDYFKAKGFSADIPLVGGVLEGIGHGLPGGLLTYGMLKAGMRLGANPAAEAAFLNKGALFAHTLFEETIPNAVNKGILKSGKLTGGAAGLIKKGAGATAAVSVADGWLSNKDNIMTIVGEPNYLVQEHIDNGDYLNATQEHVNSMIMTPELLREKLKRSTAAINELLPNVSDTLLQNATAAIHFLSTKGIDTTAMDPTNPNRLRTPTKYEFAKFEKYVAYTMDPSLVLKDLENGIITTEGIETLATVYPEIYKHVVLCIDKRLQEDGDKIDRQTRNKLSRILNYADPNILELQGMFYTQEQMQETPKIKQIGVKQQRQNFSNQASTSQRIGNK